MFTFDLYASEEIRSEKKSWKAMMKLGLTLVTGVTRVTIKRKNENDLVLEKRIDEVTIKSKELGFTRPGEYIYEFLSYLNITFGTASKLIDTIENAVEVLEDENLHGKGKSTICRLESISDILNIIFRDGGKSQARHYRFHVHESRPNVADPGKVARGCK